MRTANPTAPCAMCADRRLGCHGTCERYKAYKSAVDEVRKALHRQTEGDANIRAIKQNIAKSHAKRRKGDDR